MDQLKEKGKGFLAAPSGPAGNGEIGLNSNFEFETAVKSAVTSFLRNLEFGVVRFRFWVFRGTQVCGVFRSAAHSKPKTQNSKR
jgi:hypothetical protein